MMRSTLGVLLLCCLMSVDGFSTTYYNKLSGAAALQTLANWGTATDGTGTAPTNFTTAGDVFNLYNGTTATISAAWVLTGVTLNVGGGATMNFTIPSGFSLTGTGIVNVSANATLTLQNATNPTLGTLNANSTVNYNGTGTQTIAANTYGNISLSGARSGTPAITLASGTITIGGNFLVSYSGAVSFSTTGSTVVYSSATGGQSIGNITYNNLTLNNTSGTNTACGAIVVNTSLTTAAGGTLDMSTFALSGAFTPTNNGTIQTECTTTTPLTTGKSWAGNVVYNVPTGAQTIMAGTYNNLTLNNSSGTNTASGVLTINGSFTNTSGGTLNMGAYAMAGTPAAINNDGTITTSAVTNPALPANQDWTGATGQVTYALTTGGQYVPAGTYQNLTFNNTSGTNTAVGVLTVTSALTTTSGGTLAMGLNQLSGAFTPTNNGTITTTCTGNPALPVGQSWAGTTGAVTFAATTGGQYIPGGTYTKLTCSNTSNTNNVTGGDLSIATSLITTAGGTLNMGTNMLGGTLTTLTNGGIITTQNTSTTPIPSGRAIAGTINYNAPTGGQTIVAETSYATLIIGNSSGTNTAAANIVANTALTTTAGGTLDMTAAYTLTGTLTTITNNGTIKTSVPTATSAIPVASGKTWGGTGTFIYAAPAGLQTVMAGTYNCSLTMANTAGINTASGTITANSNFTTTAGDTLDMSTFQLLGAAMVPANNGTIITKNKTSPAIPANKTWGGNIAFYYSTGGQYVPAGTYQKLAFTNTSGTQTATGTVTVNSTLTTTSGGTLSMAANQLLGGFTPTNNGTISTTCTVNPAIPAGLTWAGTTGNVTFASTTGGQFVPAGTYQALKFSNSSGINTAVGNIVVNTGTMTTTSGGTLDMGSAYILSGTGSFSNSGTIQTSVPTSVSATPIPPGKTFAGTITYANLTGGQTIVQETSYTNLVLKNTSGTNTAAANIPIATSLVTTAGGTLNMTAAYVISGSPGTITNNGTIITSVPTSVSAAPFPSGRTWGGTGTVVYNAPAGLQTVMGGTYNCNLTVNNTSGTNTAAGIITMNGTLTTTSGGTLNMSSYSIAGTGSFVNNGTITTSTTTNPGIPAGKNWTGTTGVVIFALATGGQSIPQGTYQILKAGNTSGTISAVGAITVNNSLITTTGGTLAMGANQLLGGFAATNNGTLTTTCVSNPPYPQGLTWSGTTGAVTFASSTGGQYVPGGIYKTLKFNNTTGADTATGDITANGGTLTTTAGGTLDMGAANTLYGTGTFTNNGTIKTSVPTSTNAFPIPAGYTWGGTINYAATAGGQTIVQNTYNNLLLSNTSGTNTADGNTITVNGAMTTTAGGTLDMGIAGILTGTGTVTNNGTISTSVPSSTSTTEIPSGRTWGGTIVYGAPAGSQTIVQATAYNNLTIGNTSGTDTTLNNVVVNGILTDSTGGIFDLGSNTLTGTLTSTAGNGLIRTQNTTTAPIKESQLWSQAFEYYSATGGQTIVSGTYGGLINTTAGAANTAEASGTINVNGPLTLTAGSILNDNGDVITVTGNILGTGTHTGTGGIAMTGGGSTISAVTLGNLSLNSAGGFSLTGNVTINGTLTLTSGRLDISTDTLALSSSGTIAGSFSSANMIIANGGGMVTTSNQAGTYVFPIGDNTPTYTPLSLTFLAGSAAPGAFFGVNITKAKHPQNANTTNYINRYWSCIVSGVTNPVYNISATYVAGDVTGTESGISMGEYPESLPWIKYGAANTSTHTITANNITDSAADFSGIAAANPTLSIAPSSAAICSGGSVGLTATGSGSPTLNYSWSPSTGLSATSGASVTAAPTTTGSVAATYVYTVTMTDGNGFVTMATASVTANPVPVITGTVTVCIGQTTTLASSLSGGTWSSSNTAKATVVATTGVVRGVASGTANITYTATTGCTAVATISVNAVPSAITGVNNTCAGATTTLTESVPGGVWSSSDPSIATVSSSGSVTGVAGGTTTISYISGSGCYVTDPVSIGPIVAIAGNTTACVGLTTALSDATTGGTWISGSTSVATIGSTTGVVTGAAPGTATITYSLSAGCTRTAVVTINAVPSAIAGTASVCAGLATTFTEAVTGGTWSSSDITLATVGSTGIVTGVAAGSATISYISGASCYVSKAITVNPLPAVITGTQKVCAGLTTALADATTGGTWASSSTTIATAGTATGIVTGVAAGTSTITYTLPTGCIKTAIATVNPLPANITGTAAVCQGLASILGDATTGGTWSSGATAIATIGSASGALTGVTAGNTVVTYILPTGCVATATATVNPLPPAVTGTASVCAGLTTTLSDAATGGAWTSSNTATATVVPGTGTVRGVTAGTTNITYTLPTGCLIVKTTTVNPLPAAIAGTATVCLGQTVTLRDATTGGTWSTATPSVATAGSGTGVITGVAAGTSAVTYTLATGCIATSTETVNPLPAGITGATSFCDQTGTTLNDATTGGTWSSSDVTNAVIGSSSGIVTAVSSGPAIITYTLPTSCIATTGITVNPLPSAIVGTPNVCAGFTTTLSDPDGGGTWASTNTAAATIGSSSGIVYGITAGTTTISYTFSTGCSTATGFVVNPQPEAGVISGPAVVCASNTATLTDTAHGGVWSSANNAIATVDASGAVSGVATGSTLITYTISNTCGTDYDTAQITVNPLPDAGYFTGNTTLCSNATTTLGASTTGGVWSCNATAIATVGSATGVVCGVSAGGATISYVVTNSCGSDENDTTITVNGSPSAITGALSVCPASTSTLSDAGGGTWASSTASVATIGSGTGIVSGVTAGTTTISYVLSNGCKVGSVFTVNPLPSAISGTTTVCRTATTTLIDAGGGTWASSTVSVATVGSGTGVVSSVTAGTTTITYTLSTGCKATTVVTVNNAPALASATNSGPICAGATLNLTANTPTNVTGYAWTGPVAITNTTSASASVPLATTAASGTYTVTVNNGTGAGCSATYTTTATVSATPTAAPTNNSAICIGSSATLIANPAGGASVYTWSGTNLSSTTAQNPTATPTVTTTYSLTVTNGTANAGCAPATVYTTIVTVNPVPTASPTNSSPICNASAVTLTANPNSSANTYVWSGSNLSSTTAQNPSATPSVTTTYSLTVSYNAGRPGCSPSTIYTTTVTVRPTGYWIGATSTAWNDNTNWCGNVPVSTSNVLIPTGASYYPAITSGTWPANNLTIQTGASLTINGGALQVGGAIANSGTFTATNGTVEFNGSAAQTIPSGVFAGNTIKNLTANNTAGVALSGPLNVSGIMKATTGNFNSGGNLTLLSTAAQTALIDGSGAGEVLGNVTMQCFIDSGYGYKYISSPFTSATVGGFASYVNLNSSTFPNFYSYDESQATNGWVIDTATTAVLNPLQGYAGNFGSSFSPVTASLTGIVNNHSLSTTLYNHNNTYTLGYNLQGNPYPSPIDWNASVGWTKTNVDNAIYFFNSSDTNQYTGVYSSYVNGISSDGIASNIIPSMQGFFVHVSSGTYPVTATLGMTNSVRTNNLSPVFHKTTNTSSQPLLRLTASCSGGQGDPVVVYFDDRATASFNKDLDALKIMNTDVSIPSIYTINDEATRYSIQALQIRTDSMQVVPLGIEAPKDGNVTFNAQTIANMPAGLHVYLYDARAGVSQDLQAHPTYSHWLSSGRHDNRFFLMYTTKDKAQLPVVSNELNAYTHRNHLFVYLAEGAGDLMVTDMAGQVVTRTTFNGTGYHVVTLDVSSGIYIATLVSEMGRQSKKVLIDNE